MELFDQCSLGLYTHHSIGCLSAPKDIVHLHIWTSVQAARDHQTGLPTDLLTIVLKFSCNNQQYGVVIRAHSRLDVLYGHTNDLCPIYDQYPLFQSLSPSGWVRDWDPDIWTHLGLVLFSITLLNYNKPSFEVLYRMGNSQAGDNTGVDSTNTNHTSKAQTGKRRMTCFEMDTTNEITENVLVIATDIDEKTQLWLMGVLQSHYLFCVLRYQQRRKVARRMVKCSCSSDEYVFRQGEKSGAFFVIQKGTLDVEGKGGYKKGSMSVNDSFGQLGLLYNVNRSASIRAKTDCQFWCLTKNNFKVAQKEISNQNYKNSIEYVKKLQLFQYVTQEQKNSIAYAMYAVKHKQGSVIYKINDEANSFFIIKSGEVMLKQRDTETIVKEESYFGDECFQHAHKPLRVAYAEAVTSVECLFISREAIKNILGDEVKSLINYNILKSALSKSQFFSRLGSITFERLIHLSKHRFMKNDDVIFESDRQPNKIVVILYGYGFNQKIGTMIGEDAFLLDRKPSVTVRKQGDGEVAQISYDKILKIFKETNLDVLRKKRTDMSEELSCKDQPKNKRGEKEMAYQSRFESLQVVKILEEGARSKHLLAQNTDTGSFFLIQMIYKSKYDIHKDQKLIVQICNEKNILEQVDHPFLPRLITKHNDSHFAYLVFEYSPNYSLFDVMREIGLLKRVVARFYMAAIILALQYLHSKEILLRDLKPQNIVVYENGYLKISDLSSAKKLNKEIGLRTFTLVGTPHYMAPEMHLGKGYSYASDLWSAGIIFYQFVIGRVPFGEDEDDPYKIHKLVLSNRVYFPNAYQDENGKEIILQLLNKSPQLRLSKGYNNLKAHSFFNNIDWSRLERMEEPAPFKSKKFFYGQVLPLETPLEDFIRQQKKLVPRFTSQSMDGWDQDF